ncbi:hypothetical protein Dda_9257 [Drechslerella dactyloides]|uniref:Uncharacterized protein n=1 Tax=Drechslerella dactyloides TaxID=74499 RepID=A0AAD6IPH5_DREDA|nr:hypothetical protein Dda_9257 [Drechslerella dactyloides]
MARVTRSIQEHDLNFSKIYPLEFALPTMFTDDFDMTIEYVYDLVIPIQQGGGFIGRENPERIETAIESRF